MSQDGGPAFPSVGEGFGNPKHSAPGMTLRQWYVGMALAVPEACSPESAARWAVMAADAALRIERETRTKGGPDDER